MSVLTFDQLPDSTRLWIFGCARPFQKDEAQQVAGSMAAFMEEWTAHKRELRSGWRLEYKQFIMVAVDESQMAASGCSIDSMVNHLRGLEKSVGSEIVATSGKIFFRDVSQQVRCVTRNEFRDLARNGKVTAETTVFDNTIQTLAELRQKRWELPMRASWHGEVFAKFATEPDMPA